MSQLSPSSLLSLVGFHPFHLNIKKLSSPICPERPQRSNQASACSQKKDNTILLSPLSQCPNQAGGIHKTRDTAKGTIVKATPTFTPQIIDSRLRLLSLFDTPFTRDRIWTSHGYIVGLAPQADPILLRTHAGRV